MTRQFWLWIHRWLGLLITVFLVIVGLTGSLLAFNFELERIFAPRLFATQQNNMAILDLAKLVSCAEIIIPTARVEGVSFTQPDQVSVSFVPRINPHTKLPYVLGFNEFFIDPWTGKELGRRTNGNLNEGLINMMPFIYDLHWRLLLGDFGQWTLGIVAVIWTIDCFNGFYLTLPNSLSHFWRRWKTAWLIKRGASVYRLNFDLHRASGLWLWPLLFIFAWSSVMMNLRFQVYDPVTKIVFDYKPLFAEFKNNQKPNFEPKLDWQRALKVGERLIAEQATIHQFRIKQPISLSYSPESGSYFYEVRSSKDVFERAPKGGGTYVFFDGNTGNLKQLTQPTGEHAGNTIESWLYALHMARVFGRPYQIFVCLLGLVVSVLSITGVYIWLKKRKARQYSDNKRIRLEAEANA